MKFLMVKIEENIFQFSLSFVTGSYNLTVPNKLSRHASTSKLEEIHTDHIKIMGELENDDENNDSSENAKQINTESPGRNAAISSSVHQQHESQIQESSTNLAASYQQSQSSAAMMSQSTLSTSSSQTTTSQSSTSIQKSETYSESFSSCQQSSSSQTTQQLSMKVGHLTLNKTINNFLSPGSNISKKSACL